MSDLSSPDINVGIAPEKPLNTQNMELFNTKVKPLMGNNLLEGFYNSSEGPSISYEEAGVCLKGQENTTFNNRTRQERFTKNQIPLSSQTIIIRDRLLPDGKTDTAAVLYYRAESTGVISPEMLTLLNADPNMPKAEQDKLIHDVLQSYMTAQVDEEATKAEVEKLREKATSYKMAQK